MRWLVLVLIACGGSQHARDDGPACDAVADHLLELANRDNEANAGPALASGIRGQFEQQCRDDKWSAARRRCLHGATTQDATVDCPER